MSNYNKNTSIDEQSAWSKSSYIFWGEQKQSQWINSVAKQAAKLISDQLKNSNALENTKK